MPGSLVSDLLSLSLASRASAEVIDFETIPPDTLVTNQYESIGVSVSGVGALSGLVISEGTFGSQNFGNSPTKILHIGERDEPTRIQFVDPADPSQILGATSFSLLVGDGDSLGEDFSVTYFDPQGVVIATNQYSTLAGGIRVTASNASLGALIGSVELRLLGSSQSGAAADDLYFQLANTTQGHAFTKIAESSPSWTCPSFGLPAINNGGEVAFIVAGCSQVIYRGDGGPLTAIADVIGSFSDFGQDLFPDINESGLVAFYAGMDSGIEGFYVGDGGPITKIADHTDGYSNFSGYRCCGSIPQPSLTDDGNVFFKAYTASGAGIFRGDGGSVIPIYQAFSSGVTEFQGPVANDHGQVVFFGYSSITDQQGVFTGDGTSSPVTVALTSIGARNINNLGHVVYVRIDQTTGQIEHVRWDAGTGETVIVDLLGEFSSLSTNAINDNDEVSFQATLDSGGGGIWTTRDLVSAVVRIGDTLFGSTVTQLKLSNRALNDRGEVAFTYELTDGRRGVARATPVIQYACSNGLDDDADGKADSADFGCSSATDTSERSAAYVCDDGVDNDGDSFSDFPADPGCARASFGTENPQCSDGIDNDGDTLVDAADPNCSGPSDNAEFLVLTFGCGIGPALALALPLLAWARRRARGTRAGAPARA